MKMKKMRLLITGLLAVSMIATMAGGKRTNSSGGANGGGAGEGGVSFKKLKLPADREG